MNALLKILEMIPEKTRWVIIVFVAGLGIAYAHEVRYVASTDYQKSYILGLKASIRDIKRELKDDTLSPAHREDLQEELEELMDQLCLETDDKDRLCKTA